MENKSICLITSFYGFVENFKIPRTKCPKYSFYKTVSTSSVFLDYIFRKHVSHKNSRYLFIVHICSDSSVSYENFVHLRNTFSFFFAVPSNACSSSTKSVETKIRPEKMHGARSEGKEKSKDRPVALGASLWFSVTLDEEPPFINSCSPAPS